MTPERQGTALSVHTALEREFRAFVESPDFPCLAGKGAMRAGGGTVHTYGALGSARSTSRLANDLSDFSTSLPESEAALHAFVALFPRAAPSDEASFEDRLWLQLQRLHEREAPDVAWDPEVSADPANPLFSFSFAGRAFFVVGMHAASSRLSRRFSVPALVFNPHAQFEQLRHDGRFASLQAAVRQRDLALQGSLNPNLAAYGESSEARQYSGRASGAEWMCPFHRRTT